MKKWSVPNIGNPSLLCVLSITAAVEKCVKSAKLNKIFTLLSMLTTYTE